MSQHSRIEWCNATWNCITGCRAVSPGCKFCYAARLTATRLKDHPRYKGLATIKNGRGVFTGKIRLREDKLLDPLKWRKPRMIFTCSMADVFHPDVPFEFIDKMFAVMLECQHHIFQILTKRPERMAEYFESRAYRTFTGNAIGLRLPPVNVNDILGEAGGHKYTYEGWRHVWCGTSVEDQERADERIPHLLRCPAAVRFLSCEPLLGPISLSPRPGDFWLTAISGIRNQPAPRINWVIAGGESGPNARPMHIEWARRIRDDCQASGVPFFMKQMGKWIGIDAHDEFRLAHRYLMPDGSVYVPGVLAGRNYRPDNAVAFGLLSLHGAETDEWPKDLQIREYPEPRR